MKFRTFYLPSFLLAILFGLCCLVAGYLVFNDYYLLAGITIFLGIVMLFYLFQRIMKPYRDMHDFAEAVRVRDFSRTYSRDSDVFFHRIKQEFLNLNIEKELKQQYLKIILEVVDTGILAYEIDQHTIFLSNEAFRKMMRVPDIKSITWLQTRNNELYTDLLALQPGDNKIISLNIEHQMMNVLANVSIFQTTDGTFKLIAFQNVNATLEEVEATAWKRLLSVMTHEIMNSVAPVSSLADTLKNRIDALRNNQKTLQKSDIEDIIIGIETIKHRSDGLLQFAETYRNLNKTIVLHTTPTDISRLFENVYRLMNPSLKQQGINFKILSKKEALWLDIDPALMEQVLINLIVNAADAVHGIEQPTIYLSYGLISEGKIVIMVADNGIGISPDLVDKIFIPFFSTKKKGNGIGLSLSRQIVQQHGGNLLLQTKQGEGSVFSIVLPVHR